MPNREEIHNRIALLVLSTQSGATTPQTSSAVDTLGFDSCMFNVHIGATIGSAVTAAITECDTFGGSYTAAPATSVIDDSPTPAANTTFRIGYVGNKRYCKVVVTPTGATDITASASLGYAAKKPTDNPNAVPA